MKRLIDKDAGKDERQAVKLLRRLGADKIDAMHVAIHDSALAKMNKNLEGCHPGFIPSGYTALNFMSGKDQHRVYLLGMAGVFARRFESSTSSLEERVKARRAAQKAEAAKRRAMT